MLRSGQKSDQGEDRVARCRIFSGTGEHSGQAETEFGEARLRRLGRPADTTRRWRPVYSSRLRCIRIQHGAGGCTRRQRPTTSGAFTSSTHSLSDPSYTLTLRYPSKVRAKASRLAEIPPPQ